MQGYTESFEKINGIKNILVLGVDSREDDVLGYTDIIMIISVDTLRAKIKIISIMWDSYVDGGKINGVYSKNGIDYLKKLI